MKKSVPFNKTGISKLPDDKPALYKIQTPGGKTNYDGVAKKGRVQERLMEHLPGAQDPIPGAKITIKQMPTIQKAKEAEKHAIQREQPKYNEVHKKNS
jgi:hypothetical protein